ncbi:MAG: hypothetical protein QXL94_00550 [Candidatus Parvarchaeum sp.]
MKIYHLEKRTVVRQELDPHTGIKNIRQVVIKPSNYERLVSPEGVVYEAESDGSFDVPPEFGQMLLKTQGWEQGVPPILPDFLVPAPKKTQTVTGVETKK